nr:MAG TPA: hypothetical protein [Caudoviricetes sp.]
MAWSTFKPDSEEPIYLSNLTLLCSTAPGAAVAGENLLGTGLNLILFYMCNGSMVNRHLRHINRVRATGSILMANSISERSGYVAVRESKFIVASANRFVPCWLINHSSSSRLVYGVVGGPHLPCVLMRRLAGGTRGRLGVRFGWCGVRARRRLRSISLLVLGLHGTIGRGVLLLVDLLLVSCQRLGGVIRDLVHHVLA